MISRIYDITCDVSLVSYAMEAVLDTGFPLSYRDQILKFLLPLFPAPSSKTKSSHIHSLARLLVTLNIPSLTMPLLTSLVPKERLLAYQFAFDLAEGGTREFLEGVRKYLPEGTEVCFFFVRLTLPWLITMNRKQRAYSTNSAIFLADRSPSNFTSSFSNERARWIC